MCTIFARPVESEQNVVMCSLLAEVKMTIDEIIDMTEEQISFQIAVSHLFTK